MKNKIILVITFCVLILSGCGDKDTKSLSETESKLKEINDVPDGNKLEWVADITHDGVDDKIIIDLTYIKDYPEDDVPNVKIYSGSTGELIWEEFVTTAHTHMDGIYLYNDGEKDYLMTWQPYMAQGNALYRYKIIKLADDKKDANKEIIKEGQCDFSINYNVCEEDCVELEKFSEEVNWYLEKSVLLVDTNNGAILYSTPENRIMGKYNPESDLDALRQQLENVV